MKKFLILILVLFALPLFCGDNLMDDCATQIFELKKEYTKIQTQNAKREQKLKKAKAEYKKSNDDNDDDDDDDDSDTRRDKRRAALKADRKERSDIGDQMLLLKEKLLAYQETAQRLQTWLNEKGIGDGFDFPFYARQMITFVEKRGVRGLGTADQRNLQLNAATNFKFNASDADPDVILDAVSYDLACLRAAGVDPAAEVPVPENYRQYRTFFRYFETLDFYRRNTGGFKTAKNSAGMQFELQRREKKLKDLTEKMETLLKKNDSAFARKMDLDTLMTQIDRHLKTQAFRDKDSLGHKLEDFQKNGSLNNKNLSGKSLEQMMDPKRRVSVQTGSAKGPKDNSIPARFKDQFAILDGVADSLRSESLQIQKGSVRKKRAVKKKNAQDIVKEPSPYAVYFADKPSKEAMAAALNKAAANGTVLPESAKETPERDAAVTADEQKKFNQDREAFRKEFIQMKDLLTNGIDDASVLILKRTFSTEETELFDALVERKCKAGKFADDAAAEAFIFIRNMERQGEFDLSGEEIVNIRDAMTEYREQIASDKKSESEKSSGKEPEKKESGSGESEWE